MAKSIALFACIAAMLFVVFNENAIDQMGMDAKKVKNVVMILLVAAVLAIGFID